MSGGGGICKISEMPGSVKGGCLLTKDAKYVLRVSEEKCLNAVEVFSFVVPIDRNSRHRFLLDLTFASLVSKNLLLAVSKSLETKERMCLCSGEQYNCFL